MTHMLRINGTLAVIDTLGAQMLSFSKGGRKVAWEPNAEHWNSSAPILFPFPGALNDGCIEIMGKTYSMEKHGFARNMQFEVVAKSADSIRMELVSNEQTRAMYPFDFCLSVTHTITENGFVTIYTVANTGEGDMQFCIGGHPAFSCPMVQGEQFEQYQIEFEQVENTKPLAVDKNGQITGQRLDGFLENTNILPLRYSDYDNDAIIFDGLKSTSLKLVNPTTGSGMRFSYCGFPVLALWTPTRKNSQFICLEPWLGLPTVAGESGKFEDKPFAKTLEPDKEYQVGYRVDIL